VEHCRESNVHGREVGGLLVGHRSVHETADGVAQYDVVLTNAVPVKSFDSSSVRLTFAEDEWTKAEEFIRHRLAPEGKVRIGWYHTHPLQGIFFSGNDQDAHQLFGEPYEFALVIDPRSMEAGLFYWASYSDRHIAGPICFPLT
jgi:proteasome lid subunit RPN8/RPN11